MRVPAHWTTFTARKSPIDTAKNNAHHAADPINALLNYAYRLAEIECRLACLSVGLDPAMGLHHADKPGRDSFALDLVEILRPQVDRFILDLLCANGPMRYLSPTLFAEEPDGACRLVPPITHLLAEQALCWAQAIAPHADHVARMLARIRNGEIARSTRITNDDPPPKTKPRRKPNPPLRLSGDVTVERIIPDDLWTILSPVLPEDTQRPRTGRPARENRAALAGIACATHLGYSWAKLPLTLGISTNTCKRRLNTWQQDGTWTAINAPSTPTNTSSNYAPKPAPALPEQHGPPRRTAVKSVVPYFVSL